MKKKDLIKSIVPGDIIKDKINGEIIKVTFVNKYFLDGVLHNTPRRDNFDSGERQLGNTDYIKL